MFNLSRSKIHSEFARETLAGLRSKNKYLSSKYFYDARGSKIFQDIMNMEEYYLTDCELEIFQRQKQDILWFFTRHNHSFNLIEFGAGDGTKTKILLSYFVDNNVDFTYIPMDISSEAVNNLVDDIKDELPMLRVDGRIGDYFKLICELKPYDNTKKILLFLGSNIGNFKTNEAEGFFEKIAAEMQAEDLLFIGFDLKKNPEIILRAYNDPHGHTAAFNLNLLDRINKEFSADFDLKNFIHEELYSEETGAAKSYLVSKQKQSVWLKDLEQKIHFEKDEKIYMEISQKFDPEMINNLAENTGFEIVRNFYDERQYFMNSLWKLKK